jgi:hypothetical protein
MAASNRQNTPGGFFFNPQVGNGALPQGIQGSANRAYTRDVTQNELSGNQMTGLLAQGGQYIGNARQRGLEQAASRGLLNSSAASGSAERAAIEAAMPMALQQANAYEQAAGQNLQYLNQYLSNDQNNSAQLNAAQMAAGAQSASDWARAQSALQLQREQNAFGGEQNQLDRQQQVGRDMFALGGQNWMENNNLNRGMQSAAYGTALGLYGQGMSNIINLPNQLFSSGLMGEDYFANPEEMSNFFGGFYQAYSPLLQGTFGNLFADLGFGGP